MSLRAKILIGLLLVGLVVAWPVAAHYKDKWKVEDYKRQLKSSGEKLSIGELIPREVTDARNGAAKLISIAYRLPHPTNLPPAMKLLAPGRALIASQQDSLPTWESTNIWPALGDEVDENEDPLAEARVALHSPVMAFDLSYLQGFNLLFPHLTPLKVLSQWLSEATILDLHEGRFSNACENLQALVALAERNKAEPMMMSELVRIAAGQFALNATWEALQYSGWRDDQLEELQAARASMDFLTQAESALAMHRAMCEKLFAEGRMSYAAIGGNASAGAGGTGLAELTELGKEILDDPKEAILRYPGYWGWKWWYSYADELGNMQYLQGGIETIRSARNQKPSGLVLKKFEQRTDPRGSLNTGIGLGFSLTGTLDRFFSRVTTFEMERSLVVATIALKRYHLHSAVQRCKFLSSQAILLQRINVCGLTVRQFPKGLAQGLGPAVYQFVSGICDSCRCGAGIPEQLLC